MARAVKPAPAREERPCAIRSEAQRLVGRARVEPAGTHLDDHGIVGQYGAIVDSQSRCQGRLAPAARADEQDCLALVLDGTGMENRFVSNAEDEWHDRVEKEMANRPRGHPGGWSAPDGTQVGRDLEYRKPVELQRVASGEAPERQIDVAVRRIPVVEPVARGASRRQPSSLDERELMISSAGDRQLR